MISGVAEVNGRNLVNQIGLALNIAERLQLFLKSFGDSHGTFSNSLLDRRRYSGAFATSYLYELEQKLGRPIAESFDLIAGTSTGGIIAAGLAQGMSAEEMHNFYVRYGARSSRRDRPTRPEE